MPEILLGNRQTNWNCQFPFDTMETNTLLLSGIGGKGCGFLSTSATSEL